MKDLPWNDRGSGQVAVVLRLLLWCVLLAGFASALAQWSSELTRSGDLDYAERWLAYAAYQARPDGNHVGAAADMPFNTLPHPPASYLLFGAVGRLAGADLVGVRDLGRLVTLLLTLLGGCLVVLNARALGATMLTGALGGLLFLTSMKSHMFAVSVRPDEMACTSTLLGLYLFLRPRQYVLAGALFGLALAAKHSAVSVPFVLMLALLLQREWRSALQLVAGGCAALASVATLAGWLLGPYWWQGCLLQGFHGADLLGGLIRAGRGFSQPALVIGVASVVLAGRHRQVRLLAACFLLSLVLNSIALVKVGAAVNYFLEPTALACILGAWAVSRLAAEQPAAWQSAAYALTLALLITPTLEQAAETKRLLQAQPCTQDRAPLVQLLRETEGPVLTEHSGLYFDSGHTPCVCPPDLIQAAVDGGKIDGTPMEQFIQRQVFKLIVVRNNWKETRFFPRTWIAAIEKSYESTGLICGWQVWRPRDAGHR